MPNASTVIISVIDDGMGMTEDVRRRCIEPFYTTKDRPSTVGEGPSMSSGSGMGLALAHGIAQRIGGELRIHSQFGQGTTIELHAPIVAPPATPKTAPSPSMSRRSAASPSSTEHGSGTGDDRNPHVPARSPALPQQRSA